MVTQGGSSPNCTLCCISHSMSLSFSAPKSAIPPFPPISPLLDMPRVGWGRGKDEQYCPFQSVHSFVHSFISPRFSLSVYLFFKIKATPYQLLNDRNKQAGAEMCQAQAQLSFPAEAELSLKVECEICVYFQLKVIFH